MKLFLLIFSIILEHDHLCFLFPQNPMDFIIGHLHQKFGHLFSSINKDMAHYNFWVTSDLMLPLLPCDLCY